MKKNMKIPICLKCNGSRVLNRERYSAFYEKKIVVSTPCDCVLRENMETYFQPLRDKCRIFRLKDDQRGAKLHKFAIDSHLMISCSPSVAFRYLISILKDLVRKRGLQDLPRYEIVSDAEIFDLWWSNDDKKYLRRREFSLLDVAIFEVGSIVVKNVALPDILHEQVMSWISGGTMVWIVFKSGGKFEDSIYCNSNFEATIREFFDRVG